LGEFIDRPHQVLLFIDQFDKLMAHPRCEAFTTSLAEDSVMRKVYTVMIVVTSEAHYNEILNWNGRQKIRSFFQIPDIVEMKWTKEDFKCLLEKTTTEEERKKKSYDRFFAAWEKAGTPGYMLQTRFMKDIAGVEVEAERLSHLWPEIAQKSSSQDTKE